MRYPWLAIALATLTAACGRSPEFAGAYALIGYAEPGTHVAKRPVPQPFRGMRLELREDGSATMHIAGLTDSEGEYSVNPSDHSAMITNGGTEQFFARFSHDTLVTRVPGGGPSFYWRRSK